MGDKSKTTHLGLDGLISATKDGVKSVVESIAGTVSSAVRGKKSSSSKSPKGSKAIRGSRYGKTGATSKKTAGRPRIQRRETRRVGK
tara:strand:- start:497 stop:757 length:261 start_codon:yes stop_codon:yes gene_type:complete